MSKNTGLIVRRNVAVSLSGQLTSSAVSLLADGVAIGSMLFNFNPTDPDSGILMDAMDEKATREWSQHQEEPFPIKWWAMERVQLSDREDDDDRASVRLVLISPELETLNFVSSGALKSLDRMRLRYGDGPYDPAIPVTVREIKIGGGKAIKKFRCGLVAISKSETK